jgi:hypothetical protein
MVTISYKIKLGGMNESLRRIWSKRAPSQGRVVNKIRMSNSMLVRLVFSVEHYTVVLSDSLRVLCCTTNNKSKPRFLKMVSVIPFRYILPLLI